MSFPGPQKNKVSFFVRRLYEDQRRLGKRDIMPRVEKFEFAPDVQVFFEDLPERNYDEQGLVDALNDVISRRGRADAIGGKVEKLEQVPPEWEEAYRKEYRNR